jgi:proteasome accessory factor B
MKKAERLLDLISFLLNAHRPVTFRQIQNAFPEDYAEGGEEAIARKFERDKADIVKMGLPLKFQDDDEFEEGGYVIDRECYSLSKISLSPDELAILCMAGSTVLEMDASPFSQDLILALNKIGYAAEGGESSGRPTGWYPYRVLPDNRLSPAVALRRKEHLESLRKAVTDRKNVMLVYHGLWRDEKTQRTVSPYGLVCRQGTWILVGRCHLRDAVRGFHVDRITGLEMNRFQPKAPDFEFPSGFKLDDYVARHPWEIRAHDPVTAVVRFEAPVAEVVVAELGSGVKKVEVDGDARILHLEVAYLDGLLPTVLWYRDNVRVLEPPELVEKVKTALEKMASGA